MWAAANAVAHYFDRQRNRRAAPEGYGHPGSYTAGGRRGDDRFVSVSEGL